PALPPPAEGADRTEATRNGPGPAREPAAGPAGFRLGALPPRLGSSPPPPRPALPPPAPPRPHPPLPAPPLPPPPLPDPPTPHRLRPPRPPRAAPPPPPHAPAPSARPRAGAPPPPPPPPAPAADASAGPAPGPQSAGTYRGLPRRVRQASLNPHLRDTPSAAA